jgi:hypothetical protein
MTAIRLSLCVLLQMTLVHAADLHLSPSGAGKKDGSSWENAFDQKSLDTAFNDTLKPGDRLLLAGGEYKGAALALTKGGESGKPKTILGVDRGNGLPVFQSTWSVDNPTKGATAIKLAPGASHITLQGLRIKNYAYCVMAAAEKVDAPKPRTHLIFDDVDMEQCRHGFYLSECDNLLLKNCDLKRYSKHGFRFEGGCNTVKLDDCTADCSEGDAEWEKKTELFPFGFSLNDGGLPNTEFMFNNCLAANNLMPLQKTKYKNGDGFVVEGNSQNVMMNGCRAIRNQDGGFDIKVDTAMLNDCVAVGNSRNFRMWKVADLNNCFSGYAKTGLWVNHGHVNVNNCTFHEISGAAVSTDDKATLPTTLKDCILSNVAKPWTKTARGDVVIKDSIQFGPGLPDKDPEFIAPDAKWNGLGDALNSRAYPKKGYHFEK